MTQPSTKPSGGRWLALDLLRFCAVFLMVQGHAFTELLDPSVRAERWFRHHVFVHGYTAPMFLFASGLAFGYTTFRAWDSNTTPGPALWKRFRRYGTLIVIGYALHLPSLLPSELLGLSPERLRAWLQVDVLQHVAVSLALCQLLAIGLRSPRRFAAAVGVMMTLAVFAAPLVWNWNAEAHLPSGLAGFVNGAGGSLFPMFPWAGFTHAGILCAFAAREAGRPSRELAWPFAVAAALALLVPIAVNHTGFQPYGVHDFWRTGPYYFFWRLGNVMAVLALLCFAERWLDRLGVGAVRGTVGARAVSLVRVVGAESLIIYVAHLVLLHGSVLNHGIRWYTGETLSLGRASAVALVLFAAMVALAKLWNDLGQREVRVRALRMAAATTVVAFGIAAI